MPGRWKLLNVVVVTLCVGGLLSGCLTLQTPAPLTPVSVQLNWTHAGPFAGFYAADQRGFFAAEGLDVAIQPAGYDQNYIASVLAGQAQFGVAAADELMLARANGQPVQVIAILSRRSGLAFVAPASAGIRRPTDIIGKKVRILPQSMAVFQAMMARAGVTPDQYTLVNLPSDVALFAAGAADVWSVNTNNFGVILQAAGYQLSFIYPEDYGVHFYSSALFTTDQMVAERPDVVLRFLRATLKGYEYAVQNPATAGPLAQTYDATLDAALENAKMLATVPLIGTGEEAIGWMNATTWTSMETTLRAAGVLTESLSIASLYTTAFLEQIYGR